MEKVEQGSPLTKGLQPADCSHNPHTGRVDMTASARPCEVRWSAVRITPSFDRLMALGRVDPGNSSEPFCMTVLALKTSRAANAVSELHGRVSRNMWQALYPGRSADEVPIGHVTNGIHLMGWMKGPVRRFWRNKLGPDWDRDIHSPSFWERILDPEYVTDEEMWARYRLRRSLELPADVC
jgi:glucan phosphorylase